MVTQDAVHAYIARKLEEKVVKVEAKCKEPDTENGEGIPETTGKV